MASRARDGSVADPEVHWRNDWQHDIPWRAKRRELVALANACQVATERSLLAFARSAIAAAGRENLALAGGSFLNILANAHIANELDLLPAIPSAPHDAGVAWGCAWAGWARLNGTQGAAHSRDRLGRPIGKADAERALARCRSMLGVSPAEPSQVAARLRSGAVVARASGRAEFGPRALGGAACWPVRACRPRPTE